MVLIERQPWHSCHHHLPLLTATPTRPTVLHLSHPVCKSVRACVHVHACMQVCGCFCMSARLYACLHACMRACMRTHQCVRVFGTCNGTHTCVRACAHTHARTSVGSAACSPSVSSRGAFPPGARVSIHVCANAYRRVYRRVHAHTYRRVQGPLVQEYDRCVYSHVYRPVYGHVRRHLS